jgi:hypothetical protein
VKTHIDFFQTFKGEFLSAKKFRNKFIRLWGTETIDDVKVMKEKFTIYPNTLTDPNIRKMAKLLGSWNEIKKADFSAIKGYYLWFDPNNNIDSTEELNAELLANKIEEYCPKDEWKTVTINYIDKHDPSKFDRFSKEQILEYIDNDYKKIFDSDNGFVVGKSISERTIGKYVLFDNDTEFKVEVLSSQVTSIVPSIASIDWSTETYSRTRYTGLSIKIRFKRIVDNINPKETLISTILEEKSEYQKKQLLKLQMSYAGSGDEYELSPKTDSIWYKNRLRYSVIANKQIKTVKLIKLILGFINTGQIKKSVAWWKKVFGLVLIVIAVVVSVSTANPGALMAALATNIGIAVLIMVVIQAEWAKNNQASAEYMGRWVKIGNAIGMLTGITAVIQNIGTALSEEAARESATKAIASSSGTSISQAAITTASLSSTEIAAINTAMNVTSEITINTVFTVGKNMILNSIGTTWQSVSMKVAAFAVSMRQKDMNSQLKKKTEQVKELQEELNSDADKSMSIGIEDLKRYTDNTSRIWTRYDYDALYGPTPSVIHIGNIQKASSYKATGLNLRAEDLL